jgi:phage tail-like protein
MTTIPNTSCYFVLTVPDIHTIGAFTSCSGMEIEFEVLEYSEGGNHEMTYRLPGHVRYPNLVLERGLTDQDALHTWLWKTRNEPELKEITIEYQDSTKKALRTWTFADAFPVRWSGPTFAASSSDIATERLEIAHSGIKGA